MTDPLFTTNRCRFSAIQTEVVHMNVRPPAASTDADRAHAGTRVLVVDDEEANRALLQRLLGAEGFTVEAAADGASALDMIAERSPDLVIVDVCMPGMNGFEVCRRLKASSVTRLIPVVLVTGQHDRVHKIRGLDAGADDFIAKPFDLAEMRARVRSLVRLKSYTDQLDSADAIIFSLARTIEARDPYTEGHCERLSHYAVAVGLALGLDAGQLDALERGAYLHDIGKIAVPDAVLLKPDTLNAAEFELVKQHTLIGDSLCSELRSLQAIRSIVRHHHERIDGSGYPDRLRGDSISMLAQIVGIADIFDAMTTNRPYRQARSASEAYAELKEEARSGRLRTDLVECFTHVVNVQGVSERATDKAS